MSSHPAERPLTWADRPLAELIRLAWPIAVSMVSYAVMTLVDTVFVAGLGRSALAAVGLGSVATFSLLCFTMGLLRAVKVLVAQAVGAGRGEQRHAYVAAGILLALGLGAATVVVGELVAPLLTLVASSEEAGGLAGSYLAIRVLSAPFLFVFVALREARYGEGDSRSPMIAAVLSNVLNIGLDYLLIIGLGLGVAGAAWATVAACCAEVLVLLLVERQHPWHGVRGLGRHLAALWRIGVPTGVQFLLEVGSFSLLSILIASMAEVEMAAHQIVLQAIHFSFLPAFAIAEASSVLAGQAVGANRDELVLGVAGRGMLLAGIYTGLCTVLFAVLGPVVLTAALEDAELVATTIGLIHVAAVFQVADAANVIARGVLRGTGDVRYTAVVGIVTAWVSIPPLTWLLGIHLGLGAFGGWLALSVEIFAGAALFWWRLGAGRWRRSAALTRMEVTGRPLEALGEAAA
ncbi:MAG TPA: MATE family efflux transporter [Kofleriaceae bacterium]|nr:MATE family efflux transporter [Kofleriaceae bacterium]